MMQNAIRDFANQFTFVPQLINSDKLVLHPRIIVAGMGGSHLAAGLIKAWRPEIDIVVHNDYGLPALPPSVLKECLLIASSYSGNTEEVLDTVKEALAAGINLAIIAVGGKLLEIAVNNNLPHIMLPDTGIQPRSALGYSVAAMLALLGETEALTELGALTLTLKPEQLEKEGKELADSLEDKVPVIYASKRNSALTYNWKIKLNETGKIPAFANVIPELNHNEMNGFDAPPHSLSEYYHFIFIADDTDHSQNQKRMAVLKDLYQKRGLPVTAIALSGSTIWEKLFNNLILADWVAYYTAVNYGLEPEQVPMVEEFKKLIS
jgi:glucose/mannose-6-phosphate isomerase